MTITWREYLLLAIALLVTGAFALVDPISQDRAYHLFVDARSFAAVPNFLNVISNLPFLVVGLLGLRLVTQPDAPINPDLKFAWIVFFAGITLTAFGSGYYHLRPDNGPLVWDRLPMTIGFMSLVAIIVAEYLSATLGKRLLWPLLCVGFASVFYWSYTESLGRGDLRPYAIVQFLPMILLPVLVLMYRSRSDLSKYIGWMIAAYVLAKVAEYYDVEIFSVGNLVSGHSIKHVIASLAPACLLMGLRARQKQR